MRTTRIHLAQPLTADTVITLPPEAARHVVRVLRLRAGSSICVFNGDGCEYPAEIIEAAPRRECRIRLGPAEQPAVESPIEVTLLQAISRGERMDWTIQKSTELGVFRIQPVFTERTEVRLNQERAARRQAHWQQVAVSAAEQSARVRIPRVDPPIALHEISPGSGLNLFLDPQADQGPAGLPAPSNSRFSVIVGPEGGLSESETGWLADQGWNGLHLGARVLRTETAGPAVLAVLQTCFGDWS